MAQPQTILRSLIDLAPAIAGGLIGGYAFTLMHLPAPWISGAMLGALLSALVRPLGVMHDRIRDAALLLAGSSMGASVTPDTLTLISKMPLSFALLVVSIVSIMAACAICLMRFHGWKAEDALLAAAPGALSSVLAIGVSRGADVVGVAVVQTLRIFILMALLPGTIGWLEGERVAAAAAAAPSATMNLWFFLATLAGGFVCALILQKARLAAPMMLGPALFGATLHGSGVVHGVVPQPVAIFGFLMIGVMIAVRMRGVTWPAMKRYAAASATCFIVAASVSIVFATAVIAFLKVDSGAALLAFAPGGVEAMTLLALALAFDPLYVGAHHIARFMGIGAALPIYFRIMDRRRGASQN